MADTQKTTYLINFEDNLDVYAQNAVDAKKEVDRLTASNKELKKSGEANEQQIEESNAALKVAEGEYRNATKAVQEAVKANNAQKNSYEELFRRWKLAEVQLKNMKNAYTTNSKGVRVLSQDYIEQSKKVDEAKKALLEFNKGISDGRLNVGRYAESFEAMGGPLGRAAGGVKSLSTAFKALLANPIVLVITAIVGAIAALVKAFKSTDKGTTEFAARFEQIKAILDVLRQRLITLGQAIGHVFKGEFKQAAEDAKAAFTGIGEQIREATKAAYDYQIALDAITDAENNYVSQAAETANRIAKLEFTAQDKTKTVEQRKAALQEVLRLSEEEAKIEQKFARQKLDAEAAYLAGKAGLRAEDVIGFIRMNDQQQATADQSLITLRNNNEAKFAEIEKLYAAWIQADTRFFEENKRNNSRYTGFINEMAADFQKLKDDNMKALEPMIQLADQAVKQITKVQDARIKDLQFNQNIADQNAALVRDSVAISQWETDQYVLNQEIKAQAAIDSLSSLSQIVGQQTAAGKAFAIAAATIDTYVAANKALADPTIPSTIARVAIMASIILRGLANVKQIASVNIKGTSSAGGSSAPTAITSQPAATRVLAQPVGASAITPSQAPAAATAANLGTNLTSESIAKALASMPRPVVSVEDINARTVQKQKVEVVATI